MGTSEAVLQVLSGAVPSLFKSDSFLSNSERTIPLNALYVLEFENVQQFKQEKQVSEANGAAGSHRDTTCKGEYDIVRNFILHTLQLQPSWEKKMNCHSPGQGLMPASFKVHTVLLDDNDSVTEEVSNLLRVLLLLCGAKLFHIVLPILVLWWIILLQAYGKCSGDLSVQERIDVQTGIKMIPRLCLADGFEMFPTLLVTDDSCMIDHCMGIHDHPLEIQVNKL
ncbi:hypothetical protein HS088_TW09G00654 [Tripterygium wilfordii]|uniref:Alkaline/neutral invertase n=1 Tax=Tripterygium wilfordii TaxID=458696 RepID=A0A7J7D8E8_TRIWF|nr:hypothetical protein HS088_TW09G00654 [Tripterygium wilfordii]